MRRAFLCGTDKLTGQNFDHRKAWLVERFKALTEVFAIQICSYAVLDNHYHLVLHLHEDAVSTWSDEEVVRRWGMIFPNDAEKLGLLQKNGLSSLRLQETLTKWKERLKSISWFMRCLNEPLARLSNKEDDCTGRFWEGRFRIQALLDDAAVLTAMAYVDLNPIRAGIASTLEESTFTSVCERIQAVKKHKSLNNAKKSVSSEKIIKICDTQKQPSRLMPFSVSPKKDAKHLHPIIDFKLSDYLELVDMTGRIMRDDKKGYIPPTVRPILNRLNLTSEGWLMMVNHLETDFGRAVGHEQALAAFKPNQMRKFKGSSKAKIYYADAA